MTVCLYKREHLFGKIVGRKIRQYRYYDYIIRNEKEYKVISEYIAQNPLKWAEDCYYKEDKQ